MTGLPDDRFALILFAHGARDPEWARPFVKIQRAVQERLPAAAVELAFLEIMEPRLPQAIEKLVREGHTRITVAPLFMAQGGHLKHDLPKILDAFRAGHPTIALNLLPAVGDAEPVLKAISEWLVTSLRT